MNDEPVNDKPANDEIRMTNDESNPNERMTNDRNLRIRPALALPVPRFRHSVIRYLNSIRHSSFVIRHSPRFVIRALAILAITTGIGLARADWLTARGNMERTGTQETKAPAIKTPKVRWAFKAEEHFVASPVPGTDLLLVSGLGAFNSAQIHAVAMDDLPGLTKGAVIHPGTPVWNKTSPFIKLPTVSSPALFEGMAIMGDGLHTTDGGVLYSFDFKTGRALWQYEMNGKLVHMEGAPLVDPDFPGGPAVLIGAGSGGVVALSTDRAMLEGKEVKLPELRKIMDERWSVLTKKYEQDKLKDDFAVPPGDESLPKATPVLLWQSGKDQWHVDAPLAISADRVVVCSAYLDDDKQGDRAVICLDRKTGQMLWRRPVELNPWAGASISGETVIVGCSSVRFDANTIKGARGELVGISLEGGQLLYRHAYPGGILSAPAIRDDLAVFTATDGLVRAVDVLHGRPRWTYKAKDPFFAGVAIAGGLQNDGMVYAADLAGVLHAISLKTGQAVWTHDVGRDPVVQEPGMVFGSPVVRGEEIFLATCNIQGANADKPCAVVAVSDKNYDPDRATRPKVIVDAAHRRIDIPALIAPRKLPSLKDIYPLEVVCTWPTPAGQKAHETVVITDVKPSEVQHGLEQLGLKPGKPSHGTEPPEGPEVKMFLVLDGPGETQRAIPLEKCIIDSRTGKTLPPLVWRFTGSATRQLDPDNPDMAYGADLTGTFATIYPVTDETVIQGNLTMTDQSMLKLELNKNIVPDENTPVTLRIEVK